jgi:hypothetical protein
MDSRYLSADASASIPSPDNALAQGFPTEGNTDLGVLATRIGAWWFYQIGEEIRNCIIEAGITPDKTKVNQLAQAIRILCDIPFASTSVFGKVKLSNNVNDTAQNTAPTSFALSQTWAEAIRDASLSAKGRVKLVNSVSSTSTSEAATPNSVKVAYDKGVDAYNLAASHQDHLTPTGAVCMFLSNAIPSGWLKLAGQTIYRSQYPSLFTKMGWGDSFTLPNMNGRFAEGSNSPGQYKSAGLPNITGTTQTNDDTSAVGGAFRVERPFGTDNHATLWYQVINEYQVSFDASRSNPIYGNSSTVQPNSVTFVYAIKVI